MAKKQALKGFSNLGVIPVEIDTTSAYATTGEIEKLIGAQSCAPTDNKTDFSIDADDGIYDSGSDWVNTTLVIAVVESTLRQLAMMSGAEFDEDENLMEEGTLDVPIDQALTYSALRRDGGYRLFRYYCCKLKSYKVSHTTKGQDNSDVQVYELTIDANPRKYDNRVRGTKDIEKGEPMSWLDTIPAMPDVTPEP